MRARGMAYLFLQLDDEFDFPPALIQMSKLLLRVILLRFATLSTAREA
jgi:hypothetical protein